MLVSSRPRRCTTAIFFTSLFFSTTARGSILDAADVTSLNPAMTIASQPETLPLYSPRAACDRALPPVPRNPLEGIRWINGSVDCTKNTDPPLQVVEYGPGSYILRQNPCLNFEAPFIYLFIGADKALLLDTGATSEEASFPLQQTIARLIADKGRGGKTPELLVVHSHGHGDHTAADAQFAGKPRTRVISANPEGLSREFGITDWPRGRGKVDLGGRVLDVLPIPGHEEGSIAIYDQATRALLTGDSLYPGRLYIADWVSYRDSIARLADFVNANPVSQVLGAHIEMTRIPERDFEFGSTYHPNEHVLELTPHHVRVLNSALGRMGSTPARLALGDFIITP